MAKGIIKSLFPPGNQGSRHGAGQITEDGTGTKYVFQTPADIDPNVPLSIGTPVTFDISSGKSVSNVRVAASAPTCTLAVNLPIITLGQSIILSWASTNADTLTIDNGVGAVTPVGRGSITYPPPAAGTITYTLTARNLAGQSATSSVVVNVT